MPSKDPGTPARAAMHRRAVEAVIWGMPAVNYQLMHEASARAVQSRTRAEDAYARARKAMFEEGISTSRMYLTEGKGGVEDLLDEITAGVRSSYTYAGASTTEEFRDRAVVGLQGAAGYAEGRPVAGSWT